LNSPHNQAPLSPISRDRPRNIHVAEGDALLCFLIDPDDTLAYVEHRGGVFMGE